MRNKLFKVSVILVIILTMTMTNFVFVGSSLISYAVGNNNGTNNSNIEFNTYFKNDKGEKVSVTDMVLHNQEALLYMYLNVKQEGYFNGTISLADGANFKLVESDNQYVKNVENNTINLYHVTAGTSIEIPVKIEPVKEETYDIDLLDVESKIILNGIYKDSSEKDKKINATKTVQLKFVDQATQENIVNDATIITNKISQIEGQEKRVVQLSWNVGLKNNSYPIREIVAKLKAPILEGKEPQIQAQVNLNTMTSHDYQYQDGISQITFKNEETSEGTIDWKTSGVENIIVTYLFDKEVPINDFILEPEVKIILYNEKEVNGISQVFLNQEEKDAVVEVTTQNQEDEIYKGKLMAGLDRPYLTKTNVKVNLAKMVKEITVQENASTYTINETQKTANVYYLETLIEKESLKKILGENGSITITNQNDQVIGIIDATMEADENGYIVIHYGDSQTQSITIKMTTPETEGTLEFNHRKNIKETQRQVVKEASRIHHVISCQYNQGLANQVENNIHLKDTITESKIEVDTNQLSTVVNNHIKMKITLLSNEEKYDLYENPNVMITLPKQVEGIQLTNVSKLYDDNHEFSDTIQYAINGNQINLVLNGKQTDYTSTVEGITLVVEADLQVNKTAATSEEQIILSYQNSNVVSYANNAVASTPIRITAPKEITAVNRIHELAVETIGEEETTEVMMEKGSAAKQVAAQMEIINSNVTDIKDVKILGDFPTDSSENNMGIAITKEVQVTGTDKAKVYYSTNEKATDDITDAQNQWSESLNSLEAKKYLISLDTVDAQSSVQANYQMMIPENLAYNEVATEGYSVRATNRETGMEINLDSTKIAMQTGVGPQVESELYASVGEDTLKPNDTVKNGEVMKYQVKVSNTGTEEATNIKVMGKVPEGTTLVKPMHNYNYTGAAYYQEVVERVYTQTIEKLAAGETKMVQYEVRIDKNTQKGTELTNEVEVQYGEAKTKSTMTNVTDTSPIRVSLKRITDLTSGTQLYVGGYVEYYAIIENTSNAEQKDVKVQTNLSSNAEVDKLTLVTNMQVEEIPDEGLGDMDVDNKTDDDNNTEGENQGPVVNDSSESDETGDGQEVTFENQTPLTYEEEVNIGNLGIGETKVLHYVVKAKAGEENKKNSNMIKMSTIAKSNNQTGRSNVWEDKVLDYNIKAEMKTNTQSQFVQIGDEIDYIITVENNGTGESRVIQVIDEIPADLEIQSITVNGEEKKAPEGSNKLRIYTSVEEKSTTTIIIKTRVDYHENADVKTITNKAVIENEEGDEITTTSEITHIIKGISSGITDDDGEDQDDDNTNQNQNNGTQQPKPDNTQRNNMIAGVAWLDANTNGIKDTGESLLANVKVKLLNVETNEMVKDNKGNEMTATTNSEGIYVLNNVANGKYIAIFEYDTTKYGLTTYQVSGASESVNSNAVKNTLNIGNTTKEVASTDILTVGNTDISNVNIGLIELKNFDLKLEKGISRVLIQSSSGSTVRQYDNVDMAKVELDAKKIKGSTVLIEYSIVVSNVGEVDGYAKKVVDYMPSDLKFSSELNKDWYQTNGQLYNASLANTKIAAGESKTITLTLTKAMTENNTGLTLNTAEIAEDYNELGLKDSNSTPANKAEGENDMSSAEIMISISTGGIVSISIVMIILAISGVVAFVIIKRRNQNNQEIR